MSDPVRVALVGCGRISQTHFQALAEIDDLELVAVCDIVEERAREAGEQNGVPWFTSYEQMLSDVACDAVTVCTPSGLHPQHGILAARARETRDLREADGDLAQVGRRTGPGLR